MDDVIEGLTISQVTRKIEEYANSNVPAIELGRWLDSLDRQLPNAKAHKSLAHILSNEVKVKGRQSSKLKSFLRLYRIFRDFPAGDLTKLSDQVAHQLSSEILVGRVRPNSVIKDDDCRMPRREALRIAISVKGSESLKLRLRDNSAQAVSFGKESQIEVWFKDYKEDFARQFNIEHVRSRAAAGKALRDIDHIFRRTTPEPLALILVELKDAVNFSDVGQVLGQRNEVFENSEHLPGSNYRVARLYTKYHNDKEKWLKSNSIPVEFSDIEVWIIGQVFDDSAYYAAKHQRIFLFRITNDRQIIGPCNTETLEFQQYREFTQ